MSCQQVPTAPAFNPYPRSVQVGEFEVAIGGGIWVAIRDAGIEDGSIIAVDRAIKPKHNSIVVAIVDGECTVKFLHQRAGRIKLRAANPTYPDIIPRESQTIIVWGVVSGCVKLFPT